MTKTAVITGATTGIGAAYARSLAADGYNLVITGRKKDIIEKLADGLRSQNTKVDVVIAELSEDNDFQRLVDVVKAKDDIEMLINNAGYSGYDGDFEEIDITEHEKMIKVHEVIPLRLISLILPGMIKRKKGSIINVSSMGASMPLSFCAVYCGTKAFLKTYSQALNLELRDKGIRVQALCPGPTRTNFGKDYYSKETYDHIIGGSFKNMMMPPELVVTCSLKSLQKNQWVCVPGLSNRMMMKLFPSLPAGMYGGLAKRMSGIK